MPAKLVKNSTLKLSESAAREKIDAEDRKVGEP
jgi:hypothetical protein